LGSSGNWNYPLVLLDSKIQCRKSKKSEEKSSLRNEGWSFSFFDLGQAIPDASHKELQFSGPQFGKKLEVDIGGEDSLQQFYEFVRVHL